MLYAEVEIEGVVIEGRLFDRVGSRTIRDFRNLFPDERHTRCLGTGLLLEPEDLAVLVCAHRPGVCPTFVTSRSIVDYHQFAAVVIGAANKIRALAPDLRLLSECGVIKMPFEPRDLPPIPWTGYKSRHKTLLGMMKPTQHV